MISPRKAGSSDTSMVIEIIAAQVSMTPGFSLTTRREVIMAVTKSLSRSSSIGMATTVTVNKTADRKAPTHVPMARKVQPSGVKKMMVRNPSKSENEDPCNRIASQSRIWYIQTQKMNRVTKAIQPISRWR